ncbi:MAG: hypothetical protein ACE5KT_00310 [Methanosarcinales archaeon]
MSKEDAKIIVDLAKENKWEEAVEKINNQLKAIEQETAKQIKKEIKLARDCIRLNSPYTCDNKNCKNIYCPLKINS